jgi:hypothetical protein
LISFLFCPSCELCILIGLIEPFWNSTSRGKVSNIILRSLLLSQFLWECCPLLLFIVSESSLYLYKYPFVRTGTCVFSVIWFETAVNIPKIRHAWKIPSIYYLNVLKWEFMKLKGFVDKKYYTYYCWWKIHTSDSEYVKFNTALQYEIEVNYSANLFLFRVSIIIKWCKKGKRKKRRFFKINSFSYKIYFIFWDSSEHTED